MTPPGRPRLRNSPTGRGARSDILAAAAEAFAGRGYSATTHEIADAAGISQAALYHYFSGRDEVLLTLLLDSVRPSVDMAEDLAADDGPAAARLWVLAHGDASLLVESPSNVGGLYLLPEVTGPQFQPFWRYWARLRDCYATLVGQAGAHARLADVVLSIVEGVVLTRRRTGAAARPKDIADAVARVVVQRGLTEFERAYAARLMARGNVPETFRPGI